MSAREGRKQRKERRYLGPQNLSEFLRMNVETEKKYRLDRAAATALRQRLRTLGAACLEEDFEENTIYSGNGLDVARQALRLRRTRNGATLAFKERWPSQSAVKRQREEETAIEDPQAMARILEALGFRPTLVYEKRRATFGLDRCRVSLDELPFGLFAEIEGDAADIEKVERTLDLCDAPVENATYPELAAKYGRRQGERTESRFD